MVFEPNEIVFYMFFFDLVKINKKPVGKKFLKKNCQKTTQVHQPEGIYIVWERSFCYFFSQKIIYFFPDLTILVVFLFGIDHVWHFFVWQTLLDLALLGIFYKIFQ